MNSLYRMLTPYFSVYLTILAAGFIIISVFETMFPEKAFRLFKKFTESSIFRFYGILSAAGSFPFLNYTNSLPGKILFAVGTISILTAPFILLYPGLFKLQSEDSNKTFGPAEKKALALSDAAIRLLIAALVFYSIYFN